MLIGKGVLLKKIVKSLDKTSNFRTQTQLKNLANIAEPNQHIIQ